MLTLCYCVPGTVLVTRTTDERDDVPATQGLQFSGELGNKKQAHELTL